MIKQDNRTDLEVPFSEKDQAKALGARWDPQKRVWYAPADYNLGAFAKWLTDDVRDSVTIDDPGSIEDRYGISPDNAPQLTVSDFVLGVRESIKERYKHDIWLIGQVTKVKHIEGKQLSVELIDADSQDTSKAPVARIIAFGPKVDLLWSRFFEETGQELGEGIRLRTKISVDFDVKYGLTGRIIEIDPRLTIGAIEAKLKKIRETLKREQLWNKNQILPGPLDYCRIAVIHPSGASGYKDFKSDASILENLGLVKFFYLEATFEGANSESQILQAFQQAFNLHKAKCLDAICIIRGGGARQGLMNICTEALTRIICASPIPVITGIGHADDTILLDEVAWRRCDTPSKAIAFIRDEIRRHANDGLSFVRITAQLADQILSRQKMEAVSCLQKVEFGAQNRIRDSSDQIRTLRQDIFERIRTERDRLIKECSEADQFFSYVRSLAPIRISNLETSLDGEMIKLTGRARTVFGVSSDRIREKIKTIERNSKSLVKAAEKDCENHASSVRNASNKVIQLAKKNVYRMVALSKSLGPDSTIKRGYALALSKEGKVITTAKEAKSIKEFDVRFRDRIIPVMTKE